MYKLCFYEYSLLIDLTCLQTLRLDDSGLCTEFVLVATAGVIFTLRWSVSDSPVEVPEIFASSSVSLNCEKNILGLKSRSLAFSKIS